jgi:hypothetical protein
MSTLVLSCPTTGPYRADLRFTDFSKEALATKFLPWNERYLQLCVDGWAAEVAKRYGAETMAEIEWTAWTKLPLSGNG